jgi:hypothetical protein
MNSERIPRGLATGLASECNKKIHCIRFPAVSAAGKINKLKQEW